MIHKILALVMLALFAFSITPKPYLHKCLANHTSTSAHHADKETQLTTQGFHCSCDELVVSGAFIKSTFAYQQLITYPYNPVVCQGYYFKALTIPATNDLRGPPAYA